MDMFWGRAAAPATTGQPILITILLERLRNAKLLSDRREIVQELKEYAITHQKELGEAGIPLFIRLLRSDDAGDEELVESVLKILVDLLAESDEGPPTSTSTGGTTQSLGAKNAGILLADPKTVGLLLDLLQGRELWTRLHTIEVLSSLLYNSPSKMEAAVLDCGAGMTRLVDVLEDPREEIRNELLLMLLKLTQSNPEIQTAIAFQEGFDRLLAIIRSEGLEDGGIIVCDCLKIIHNILRGNKLTQKLFVQSPCLSYLCGVVRDLPLIRHKSGPPTGPPGFSDLTGTPDPNPDSEWTEHKRDCVTLCLDIFGEVLGSNGSAFVPPKGMLHALVTLAFVHTHVQASLRIQSMSVLATILSGNVEAQFVLSQLCVPVDSSPRSSLLPALLLLIRHIVYAGTPLCPISSLIPTTSTSPPASTGSATSKYNFNYETASSIPAQDADSEAVAGLALLTAFLGGNDAGRFGLVSHAVTPPPPAAIGLPDDATPPVAALQLAVSAIVSGAASLQSSGTAVGDAGTFTSPFGDRLASVHLTMTVCRACDVMRTVFGNDPTVKEIALRIVPTVGGKPLYDVLVGALAAVLQSGNPSSRSPPTTSTVLLKCSLLRLLGDWFDGFPPAVQRFFTDPSNLFLFDIASGGDPGALATPNALTSLGTRLPNLGACWLIALAFQNFAEDPKPPSSNGKRQPKPPVTSVVTSAGISIDRSTLLRMVSNRITVPVLMRAVTALDDAIRAASQSLDMSSGFVLNDSWRSGLAPLTQQLQRRVMDVYTSAVGGDGAAGGSSDVLAQLQALLQEKEDALKALQTEVSQLKAEREGRAAAAQQDASLSAANAALQSKVSQLEHALAASQSEHAAQLQSALDIARADVEALLDGGSPQRQAPLLDVVPAAVTVSVPMVPVSPSPVKPPLDCTACASSCSVEEDASARQVDDNESAFEALQEEHNDLLVLVAVQEFTTKALEAALLDACGDAAVAKAKEIAQCKLDEYLDGDVASTEED